MRYLSLFSGIEAASMAWKPLGWQAVAFSEIEPFPCAVLAERHPGVPNLGDITKITEEDIIALGPIDIVVFGSPCQDLSVAGKGRGFTDEHGNVTRSGLFFTAMRVIGWARKHCGCRFALWENVPGAFSSNQGRDFASVVAALSGMDECERPPKGWGTEGCAIGDEAMVEFSTLDAQWFGVPQRRRRVFALADFGDWASRPPILLEPESVRGDSPPRRETGQEVTHATAPCLTSSGRGVERTGDTRGQDPVVAVGGERVGLARTVNIYGGNKRKDRPEGGFYANMDEPTSKTLDSQTGLNPTCSQGGTAVFALAGNTIGRAPANGGNGTGYDDTGVSYTLTKTDVHGVCVTGDVAHTLRADRFDASEDGTGRGTPVVAFNTNAQPDETRFDTEVSATLTKSQYSGVAQSIVGGFDYENNAHGAEDPTGPLLKGSPTGGGRPLPAIVNSAMQVRRLIPVECARLQGFPDDYLDITFKKKPATDGHKYKALGNSMAVPVMAHIGQRIQLAVSEGLV